ncbi:MAG TPA: DUF362 domain-containing protein [bacterium]|nr:DUF362 domain-containing protein [bacterium]HPR88917.1 DUF362 domain-containing protein [bacterium]
MKKNRYRSMETAATLSRREMLKLGAGAGLLLGTPTLWAQEAQKSQPPAKPKTNIEEVLAIPKTAHSLPGPFPGRVVQVTDAGATREGRAQPEVVQAMFEKGLQNLTGTSLKKSGKLFFNKQDVVGIKVNPVGPGVIATHLELVDAVIGWLTRCGLKRDHIVIWDRFDYMLADAGFTPARFPGIVIEGLQTMDEAAAEGKNDNSRWLKADGTHVSAGNYDQQVYYWADVEADQSEAYLNQHVFNGKYSYFGKLVTQRLTKIINLPVFKNTGNGVSMATKNLGYAAICNTARLHRPLFFDVCTEVLAFPAVRDKLFLNITDGLRGQYDGGPDGAAQFTWDLNSLFFATDPFALDMTCHNLLVAKRKEMNVKVNEHPRFTEYLRYAEKLGLGMASPEKIVHVVA